MLMSWRTSLHNAGSWWVCFVKVDNIKWVPSILRGMPRRVSHGTQLEHITFGYQILKIFPSMVSKSLFFSVIHPYPKIRGLCSQGFPATYPKEQFIAPSGLKLSVTQMRRKGEATPYPQSNLPKRNRAGSILCPSCETVSFRNIFLLYSVYFRKTSMHVRNIYKTAPCACKRNSTYIHNIFLA